jgi:hypothetical protein
MPSKVERLRLAVLSSAARHAAPAASHEDAALASPDAFSAREDPHGNHGSATRLGSHSSFRHLPVRVERLRSAVLSYAARHAAPAASHQEAASANAKASPARAEQRRDSHGDAATEASSVPLPGAAGGGSFSSQHVRPSHEHMDTLSGSEHPQQQPSIRGGSQRE